MNTKKAIQNSIIGDFNLLETSNLRLKVLEEEINSNTQKIATMDKAGTEISDDFIMKHSKLIREYYLIINNNDKLSSSIAVTYKLSKLIDDLEIKLPENMAPIVEMIYDSNVSLITINKGKVEVVSNEIVERMDARAAADFDKEVFLEGIRNSSIY
jgi:hypothetical protein|tara:strand:+ start:7537 stop:8004 length:468 start_codon:yes stop_codon:yes gene_type:complete